MPRNSGVLRAAPRYALRVAVPLVLIACASAPPRQASLDAAFARIQVAEARIEHARAEVARTDDAAQPRSPGAAVPPTDCARSRLAHEQASTAQRDLCAVAREIADADALVRCEQAVRSEQSIALQAARRCALPAAAKTAPEAGIVMEAK